MIDIQNAKKVSLAPQSVATNGTNGVLTIDTIGYDYCTVDVLFGTGAATTAPTTCEIGEGDTTSAYTAIAALQGGTSAGNWTLAATAGTTAQTTPYFVANIDLRGRKRYLKLSVVPGVATVVGAVANLTRGENPADGASQGATVLVDA